MVRESVRFLLTDYVNLSYIINLITICFIHRYLLRTKLKILSLESFIGLRGLDLQM